MSSNMLQEQFNLDTLHCILNQFSEDIIKDCPEMITKLLVSSSESALNESINYKNAFSSVRVLLNLYEKVYQNSGTINSDLPLPLIIEKIKSVIECSNENCNLSDNVQCDILSMVSCFFSYELLKNYPKYQEELYEFYKCILSCLSTSKPAKECKSECFLFKLKIIDSIYQALANIMDKPNISQFLENLKLKNYSKECELFAYLVLHDDNRVALQTLMHLIPGHINCFKSVKIVEIIWKQVSNSVTNSTETNSRVYILLCNFFEMFFDKSLLEAKVDLILFLLEDVNYWNLVQMALVEKDPIKRKQGLYLLKKTIDVLSGAHVNIKCGEEKSIFYWNSDSKNELFKIYSDIIISLEFLEEQQVHIIKPIFAMVEMLMKRINECGKVNFSWILLVCKKSLMHKSSQVVKWGLGNLLKLPKNFFLQKAIATETAKLLATILNNIDLYYNNGIAISNNLNSFFKEIVELDIGKNFFCLFIKEICSQVWSAEALFFVVHSLSNIQKFSFWGKKEISMIKVFVSKAFKTHNKIIRMGIQHELLNTILGFIDEKDLPLENVILLLSSFPICKIFKDNNQTRNNLIAWLRNSYSEEEVKNILEKYNKGELVKEFNENCISLMLILFYYCYYDCETEERTTFIVNYLLDIFLSFKGSNKRLYCDKLLYDQYLSIICYIYESNLSNSIQSLIRPTLSFVGDVIGYIQTQFHQVSSLQDLNACELYLKTIDSIIKTLIVFEIDTVNVKNLYFGISKDLETSLHPCSNVSSIGLYWRMKFLGIILKLCHLDLKPDFLVSYLLKAVNEPLKKNDRLGNTRDLLTLWGKINSNFLGEKWKILEYFISKGLINHSPAETETPPWISNDNLFGLCIEALDTAGYEVLGPVMSVIKNLLPFLENDLEIRKIIDSVWELMMERRKTEEFKLFTKQFVEMLFQEDFFHRELFQDILFQYSNLIFSDPSLTVVNIFMKHIQQMSISDISGFLFCHIIGRGLIFGPVKRKYEKLTDTVCLHIMSCNIIHVDEGSVNRNNEIRARAVQRILTLDKDSTSHQTAAKNLIEVLLKMENEINKNRSRYFGDSHVHRVKHRLMQALLILEPFLLPNEREVEELWDWVHNCLVSEDSQPSIRYMQEWLLVRILLRHSSLYRRFSIMNSYNQFKEMKKKGICSLFAVSFHLCKLIRFDLMEDRILLVISEILTFCFHQNFEVRLYAQVVISKLYQFAVEKELMKVTEKYEILNMNLTECFSKDSKGNFNPNLAKLNENFYFSIFCPLEHYSLQTIYMDLPRLACVGSDEWISTTLFQFCGVNSDKTHIPLENAKSSLRDSCSMFGESVFESDVGAFAGFEDGDSEEILGNYQKKMIPVKPLIPGWDDDSASQNTSKKDGLIVVASLIDRIPNLGGLARTCEIFGVSEYIISSLKHMENKEFTSLSVTAEKWVTIKEVKVQNLFDYISDMRRNGYTVIGAEQALYSQPLGSVKFPKKTLFLLGNEKEGIPPNLLPLLDICVEIPQLGIIRSLNVHVTGALFIWEYAKQNHFS